MSLHFSRLSETEIGNIGKPSIDNIRSPKRYLRASYAEIERLLAVIGNASYFIDIFKFVPFYFAFFNFN